MTPRLGPHTPLRILKFGGTSVGDSSSIRRVVEIVDTASHCSQVVVVVSAMSGVTDQLVEAASAAANGNFDRAAAIFIHLHDRHHAALEELISSAQECGRIGAIIDTLVEEGTRLCQDAGILRGLTPRTNDAITSLGERLSVPLLSAALRRRGINSEPVEATALIVTDFTYGAADPWLDITRERCRSRLLPLVDQGIVPVVTGFIGSTADGTLTTLGRGGSDYSAAILGAALDAEEVVIWTDVDGFLTADPRVVPEACTIPEISYQEACELAFLGAKVLHPKTLRPLAQNRTRLLIRNTFAPEKPGTIVTGVGATRGNGVRALTAYADAVLIIISGQGIAGVPDLLGRTLAMMRELRADVLLISQPTSQNEICVVVPSKLANGTVAGLRREFREELADAKIEYVGVDSNVALVSIVGRQVRDMSGVVERTFSALGRASVDIVAKAYVASDYRCSLVVARKDMQAALAAIHKEFELGSVCHSAGEHTSDPSPCDLAQELDSCGVSTD
jgi:bifunctional aspartokinase / homoserine dehydrogenase 1